MKLLAFLRDETGLEKVEYAIAAGIVLVMLLGLIWEIAVWVRERFRILGGGLNW